MIRIVLPSVFALLLVLFLVRPRSEADRAQALCAVRVSDQVVLVEASGSIEPQVEQLVVTPREIGSTQIQEIIDEGMVVKKGQILARLSTFRMEDNERKARVALRNKNAEYQRTLREGAVTAAEERQKIANQTAELTLNKGTLSFLEGGPDHRVVQSLDLKMDKAREDDEYLSRRLTTQEALKTRGYLSELEYESIKTDKIKAQLDRAKQENTLSLQREGARKEERERFRTLVEKFALDLELAQKQAASQTVIRGLTAAKKQAEIADRQAAVDEVLRKRTKAILKAPIDGIVVYGTQWEGKLQAGSIAFSGFELAKIVQKGIMRAKVQVNERFIDKLRAGQPAQVFVPGRSKSFPARVDSIARLATQRDAQDSQGPRDFTVTLILDREYPVLKPCMSCRASIEVARHSRVAKIPVDAVRRLEKRTAEVVALVGTKPVKKTVTVVDQEIDFVYVQGLSDRESLMILDP